MAIQTNTEVTYSGVGIREDLADVIYRVAREETPFLSMIGKSKASATKHEWQKESLAAVDTANAQLEGDQFTTYTSANNPTRLYNNCQISSKKVSVSGTAEAVDFAGRASELDRQMVLKGLELKRDMEAIICQNQSRVDGDATTARQLHAAEGWYSSNDSRGSGGADGNPATPTAATDATTTNMRAITPGLIKTVAQLIWASGGKPTTLLCSGTQKGNISGMSLNDSTTGIGITKYQDTTDAMAVFGIDVLVTDFGKLRIVPSIHVRSRTIQIIQPDMWAVAYLRNMKTMDLAKRADSTDKAIVCEYTLECRNEAASGVIADLS
jgi:hypothetical protein